MTVTGPCGGDASVQRLRFATSDPQEGTEFLRARYADHEPTFIDPVGFALDVESDAVATPLGPLRVDRLRNSAAARAEVEPYPQLAVVTVVSGRWEVVDRGRAVGGLALLPTWDRFDVAWDGVELLHCSLTPDTVRRVGAELSGLALDEVEFRDSVPVSQERSRAFTALLAHLSRDLLAHDEVMASALVRAETVRHLATSMLLTFPNTALDVLTEADAPGPGAAEPAVTRRAVQFIDGHAHEPIGLTEMAAAARVGARALQYAFRRYHDCTPSEYLRRVRMERAHRDLQAADPTRGDTVAAVAARWGFTHAGRFSEDYRRAHGRPPSRTLRE